ncbi:MAG: UvrD-helicase domain-containing protein [Planctomycetota bacterium]
MDARRDARYMDGMSIPETQSEPTLTALNEPQRQAVRHRDGPLLVLAGPGSGKTRVITRRAAHLVRSGVPARNILAITFTNKAADEMRRRIEALGVNRGMWIYTFHALGARLLREFGPLARVAPGFSIYDEADRLRVIKDAMATRGVSDILLKPDRIQAAISKAKNKLQTPEQYGERADFFDQQTIARVYDAYEQLLEQRNAVDFDDLLMRVAMVLRDHPDITERLNTRFRYVLIDEYQDTNHAQYLIARYLSQHHHNICATGDPDQSIYGWRGADIGNILEFERDYPDATIIRLEQNYRSTGNILRAASALIAGNRRRKHKELWTENQSGVPVTVWRFGEGFDEAEQIADTIRRLHTGQRQYSDIAIFYRVNALSRGLEEALRARGIPYKIARGLEFYNRKEIRDTLAYLRLLVNPADDVALRRIINTPARGIGKTSVQRLTAAAGQAGKPILEVIRTTDLSWLKTAARKVRAFVELLDKIQAAPRDSVADIVSQTLTISGLEAAFAREHDEGGEDRLANVQELVSAAQRFEEEVDDATLTEFLQRVALVSDQDQVDESAGVVLLMTLHAAKGLEFPIVFMIGLEQGLLPHENALRESLDVEEERRLCFVGITRAKEQLIMSHVRQRVIRGALLPRSASQFLRELDPAAMTTENYDRGTTAPRLIRADHRSPDEQEADEDGFVPLDDHLSHEESNLRRARRQRRPVSPTDEEGMRIIETRPVSEPPESQFADWQAGTLVRHARYGIGQIVWLKPGSGQTRAAIRFPNHGEKTFILERTPIEKLKRR